MVAVLSALIGLVLGAAVVCVLAGQRAERARAQLSAANALLAVRESELANSKTHLEQLRTEHEAALANLGPVFESLSHRVLQQTVDQFTHSQEAVMRERETTLDRTLKPLADLPCVGNIRQ